MNPVSIDIKDMLESESSLALTFQTNLFIGKEYDSPDQCVTIFDTSNLGTSMTLTGEDNYSYNAIQIRVRDMSFSQGMSLAENIVVFLHGKAHETWNNTLYCLISCITNPTLLDWDKKNRCRIIINFNIQRRG